MEDLPADPAAFLTRWVDRANAGDWSAFAELLDPDAELVDPMTPDVARGRDATVERARAQYEPFPDGRVERVAGPFVAQDAPALTYQWRFEGTATRRIDPPGFAPTGRPVVVDGVSVLRFRAGRVVAVLLFFDTTAVARQLLAAPAAGSPLERAVAIGQRLRVAAVRFRTRAGRAS